MDCLTEKLQTVQQEPVGLSPEKAKTPKASNREGSVKIREPVARKDCHTAGKEAGSKETSANSISSEILDADSPRTTLDSDSALLPLDNINTFPQISAEMVDSSIIPLDDQILSPQACQRISVKLEDDSFQDDSCNYILTHVDEERNLPWWDWA